MKIRNELDEIVRSIIRENDRRNEEINAPFNPITGEGSIGKRVRVEIPDFPYPVMWLPEKMMKVPFVKKILEAGSIDAFVRTLTDDGECTEEDRQKAIAQFVRIRCEHDFAFWAAFLVYIKCKGGGEDVLFHLNRPQRRLIERFEKKRLAGKPIRLILLKARQWGGSTVTQVYMAWLQLVHKVGLNSLIVGHVKDASTEVKDMFDRLLKAYPVEMLHELGDAYDENEAKIVGVGNTGNIHRVPQRNCKIKVGTAEKPNSARGGDYNLVHCTEVGLWVKTDGKSPADIVRSATSGILLKPYTMIVYESTANGTGNFFHREYTAAAEKRSQFEAMFVSWFEIEQYAIPFDSLSDKMNFALKLVRNREKKQADTEREQSGEYLWWLWEKGATLEAINWYIQERAKYDDDGLMAAEYPSDDEEAFVHSGARVFDKYKVNKLRPSCRKPKYVGEVCGDDTHGKNALKNIRFIDDQQGRFWIWEKPEPDTEAEKVTNRYLVVVDIGGRGKKADWSVIVVFDRLWMIDGGKPVVVAQWYGHIDMDLLAWKSAQIAKYYNNALLVIESNTLETKDKDRMVDGEQAQFILSQIKDEYDKLYARKQSEEDIKNKAPVKLGFHTNVATKPMVIDTLVMVIRENLYTERDQRCLDEYLTYERKPNGAFGAIQGRHDDLLMTRAIGLHICFNEMDRPRIIEIARTRPRKKKAVSAATI